MINWINNLARNLQQNKTMTPKITFMEKTQRKHIESNVNSYFSGYYSGNDYLVKKNQSEAVVKIYPTTLVKNSFICNNLKLHDKILSNGSINLKNSLNKDAQKFGAKPNQQKLINSITGSKIDPKSFINYLDSKFYTILGL